MKQKHNLSDMLCLFPKAGLHCIYVHSIYPGGIQLTKPVCLLSQIQVHQMDKKMDSVLRILTEQFPPEPEPELTSKPFIRRVTIQKRMGVSIDEGP